MVQDRYTDRTTPHWFSSAVDIPCPQFFYRATPCIARTVAGCLSARLSVTRRYSVETAKHILKLLLPYQTVWQYSDEDPPNGGGVNAGTAEEWVWKCQDCRQISRFISQTMQYKAIVTIQSEQESWNRTQAFERYQFQWLWVIFSDLAKYSITLSIARSLCDSWASDLSRRMSRSSVNPIRCGPVGWRQRGARDHYLDDMSNVAKWS